ncbi:MAG TPA: patatin-like phospholipase family protein [Micropepsaceae bacterium]|nr:patatin-like phospholipase family protein [Micropepsaceae bacterium]
MSQEQCSALVLQGGGALGAYELGAAQRLYADKAFAPDFIAGVSIGAITAALLARPARGMAPLEALEKFWDAVSVSGWFLPPQVRQFASFLGNPHFFLPRTDVYAMASWTNIYDLAPLRATLKGLVNVEALEDKTATPRLLVSATDVAAGTIEYFDSQKGLSLKHIIASGSLPPSFPMTFIDKKAYWDGGLFDNTPLGAVLERLKDGLEVHRTIYVVNLFPNQAPIPRTMAEVAERTMNLQFANKSCEDLKLFERFNEVAELMEELEALAGEKIKSSEGYRKVKARNYVHVPKIIPITRAELAASFDGSDFSPGAIRKRAEEGYAATEKALQKARAA